MKRKIRTRIKLRTLEENKYLEDMGVDVRIILIPQEREQQCPESG